MNYLSRLLDGLKAVGGMFPDLREGRSGNISIADFVLAAFSCFFFQSESFLAFQKALELGKGRGRSNCPYHPMIF